MTSKGKGVEEYIEEKIVDLAAALDDESQLEQGLQQIVDQMWNNGGKAEKVYHSIFDVLFFIKFCRLRMSSTKSCEMQISSRFPMRAH
eukprot:768013-Hanusia_phi.AAC.8